MNYYNEFDPFAAEWLRNLIKKGLIPDGEIDTRSIINVKSDDLRGFVQCHFFAGIGGWSLALQLAGWPDDREIWTGSCPCQPFSVAGKGKGKEDERHLWPVFHKLIAECRPPVVMGEQVAGKAGYDWFDGVAADLEREDYAARAIDIPACAVNAPHIRQRLYWVAQNVDNAAGARRRDFGCAPLGSPRNETRRAGFERRSGDGVGMADTEGFGRRGRAHDENEGRRQQPFADPCAGSGDMVDAESIGRREGRTQHDLWRGRAAAAGASGGDVGDAKGFEQRRDWERNARENGASATRRPSLRNGDMADADDAKRRAVCSGRNDDYWQEAERDESNSDAAECRSSDVADTESYSSGCETKSSNNISQETNRSSDKHGRYSGSSSFWHDAIWLNGADGKTRRAKPGVRLLVDGVPNRVGRLRGYGNAIVPPLAAEVIKAFMETEI